MARQNPAPSKQDTPGQAQSSSSSSKLSTAMPGMKISLCSKQNPFLPLPAAPGNKQRERGSYCNRYLGHRGGLAQVGGCHSVSLRGAGRGLSSAQLWGDGGWHRAAGLGSELWAGTTQRGKLGVSAWEQFGSEAALLRLCWHWAHLGSRAGSGQFSGGGQVCVAVWNSLTNAFVPFSPTALHNLYLSF